MEGSHVDAEEASAPVDLAHLARFALGAAELEREVLELFCTQSVSYLEQLRAATSHKDWCDAALSLKGSARAVGAWRMARVAEYIESLREDIPPDMRAAQIGELEASLQEASAFVVSLSEDRGPQTSDAFFSHGPGVNRSIALQSTGREREGHPGSRDLPGTVIIDTRGPNS